MAILFYSPSFCQKSAERKSPKKYFSDLIFLMTDLGYERTQAFASNKPIHYILDHGDFDGLMPNFQVLTCDSADCSKFAKFWGKTMSHVHCSGDVDEVQRRTRFARIVHNCLRIMVYGLDIYFQCFTQNLIQGLWSIFFFFFFFVE